MFVFVLSFITYLLLSWSGEALPAYEYVIALIVATIAYYSLGRNKKSRRYGVDGLSPKRWGLFVVYFFGPFLWALVKANIDVALRVLSGHVKPGIVRVPSGLKSGLAQTVLADSITLTPGTMTVDVELAGMFSDDFAQLQSLEKTITRLLKDEILITPKVKLVPKGTLAVSDEKKAVRVKDLRKLF